MVPASLQQRGWNLSTLTKILLSICLEHGNPEQHANDPNNPTTPPPIPQRMSDQELIKVIDEILLDEDKDKDGFITYHEFLMAIRS